MTDIEEVMVELKKFRDERNWAQFHNSKDLALALSIEAAELNELFLWKSPEEINNIESIRISEELADVLTFALLLADKHKLDIKEIILEKIKKNARKYPVDKSRNKADKYTEL